MGLEYEANYGIGYRVKATHHVKSEQLEDGLSEYLYGALDTDTYELFEVGESDFTGGENEIYVAIKNPFRDGLDLTDRKKKLDQELIRLRVVPNSAFDEFGGIRIHYIS